MQRLVILFFFSSAFAFAQQVPMENWYFSVKPKAGFLAAHRGTMAHLAKEHTIGGEISFYKRFTSDKSWRKMYRNPYAGVTLYGSTVGNNAILGQAFGAYGFIEFPFLEKKRNTLTFKLSTGLGYITKVFDQETNPKNVAMSSHVNALICVGLQGRLKIGEKSEFLYSLDLTHLSNGSTKVPNLGLNMPFIGLGYAYNFRSIVKVPDTSEVYGSGAKPGWFKNWKFSVLGILSTKEIFPTGTKHYPVYALSLTERKIFRPKTGAELTLDIISKQAIFGYKDFLEKDQWKILQVGIFAGYVLPLEKFHFVLGMGAYLKDRYNPDNRLYHRVGMRYQFDNGLIANLTLKSHWAKADYIEYGIGYTFKSKRK